MIVRKLPLFLAATLAISASAFAAGSAHDSPHQAMGAAAKSMRMSNETTSGSPDRMRAMSKDTSKASPSARPETAPSSQTGGYFGTRDGWWKDY